MQYSTGLARCRFNFKMACVNRLIKEAPSLLKKMQFKDKNNTTVNISVVSSILAFKYPNHKLRIIITWEYKHLLRHCSDPAQLVLG